MEYFLYLSITVMMHCFKNPLCKKSTYMQVVWLYIYIFFRYLLAAIVDNKYDIIFHIYILRSFFLSRVKNSVFQVTISEIIIIKYFFFPFQPFNDTTKTSTIQIWIKIRLNFPIKKKISVSFSCKISMMINGSVSPIISINSKLMLQLSQ